MNNCKEISTAETSLLSNQRWYCVECGQELEVVDLAELHIMFASEGILCPECGGIADDAVSIINIGSSFIFWEMEE